MRLSISFFSLILFGCFLSAPETRAARCSEIYFNKDARSFFPQFPTGNQFYGIFASSYADINNDGNLDIVAAIRGEASGRVVTFFGDGAGKFQASGGVTQITPNQPFIGTSMRLIEINDDSMPDLVFFTGTSVQIYFGNNTGSFTHHSTSPIGYLFPFCCPSLVDMFDINGDNRKDLVFRERGPKSGLTFVAFVLSDVGLSRTQPRRKPVSRFSSARARAATFPCRAITTA